MMKQWKNKRDELLNLQYDKYIPLQLRSTLSDEVRRLNWENWVNIILDEGSYDSPYLPISSLEDLTFVVLIEDYLISNGFKSPAIYKSNEGGIEVMISPFIKGENETRLHNYLSSNAFIFWRIYFSFNVKSINDVIIVDKEHILSPDYEETFQSLYKFARPTYSSIAQDGKQVVGYDTLSDPKAFSSFTSKSVSLLDLFQGDIYYVSLGRLLKSAKQTAAELKKEITEYNKNNSSLSS